MTSLLTSSYNCSPDSYKDLVNSPSSRKKCREEDRRQQGRAESPCYGRSSLLRTWCSWRPQGRGTVLHPRASRCQHRSPALAPVQLLPPVPPGQRPPGGDLRFHRPLSRVSVVSDETRSVSRGSPAGLRQVTARFHLRRSCGPWGGCVTRRPTAPRAPSKGSVPTSKA